jgi:hypothetical protein
MMRRGHNYLGNTSDEEIVNGSTDRWEIWDLTSKQPFFKGVGVEK